MKKTILLSAAALLLAGGTLLAFNMNNESQSLSDCPLKGTPECPLIKSCPDAGTPDCKLVKDCCKKK